MDSNYRAMRGVFCGVGVRFEGHSIIVRGEVGEAGKEANPWYVITFRVHNIRGQLLVV